MLTPQYVAKSELMLHGSANVGPVRYMGYEKHGFDANQLDDSTVGDIVLSEPVADFVRGAIKSELKASGVNLNPDVPIVVRADVESFEVGSWGFSIEWRVAIRLGIVSREDGRVLYDETFKGELSHGKLTTGEISGFPAAVVAQVLKSFLEDDQLQRLLNQPGAQGKPVS